jgi:hypothetical protein
MNPLAVQWLHLNARKRANLHLTMSALCHPLIDVRRGTVLASSPQAPKPPSPKFAGSGRFRTMRVTRRL